jgi:hypothetical protein
MWDVLGTRPNWKIHTLNPKCPKKLGPLSMCVVPIHRFCLVLPIKREYVSMQDLGIKSLFHLDQVEVTIVHGHLEQCHKIVSIGERDYRSSNGSFNLNLHLITKTFMNGL